MLDENQMIHPGRPGDDRDAALDAALTAADEDMLSAISNGLDLDGGLARILKDLGGSPAARPDIQAQAPTYPESAVGQQLLGELPSGGKDEPAAAADPDALASSRVGLPVPRGQAAAIIAMRARVRALACALAQAHARACALRFAVRDLGRPVLGTGRAGAIDRALTCDLTRALLQARDLTRDLMRARPRPRFHPSQRQRPQPRGRPRSQRNRP